MKTYKRITMTILVLLLSLPAMTASAKDPLRSAAIMLTVPSPSPVSIGSEITFDLFLSVANIDPGVAGVDIYLKYNPALVELSPGAQVAVVLPDFFGVQNSASINTNLPKEQCPNSNGPCIHLVMAGTPQITKNGLTARFRFRGIAVGLACFSVIQSAMVDADGIPVDHIEAEEKCLDVVVRAAVTGIVNRQGTSISSNGGSLSCSTVTAFGQGVTGSTTTDRNGSFTLLNLSTGTNTLRAYYPGYLPSDKTIVISPTNPPLIDFAATTLRGGDINDDNFINILDVRLIISKFGQINAPVRSAVNCNAPDEPADINDDSLVNISDLAIAVGNWGIQGPTAWLP